MRVGHTRLGAKILSVMVGVLVVASIVCLALLIPLYHLELKAERQVVSSKLGTMLEITLENAMLKRDIEGLREIVGRLGKTENVSAVMILSPGGEVRFSSVPEQLGRRNLHLGELCPDCGLRGDRSEAGTAFLTGVTGEEVLRSVNVVANREPCTPCHGPVSTHPVNGFLVVDYGAASLKHQALRSGLVLGVAGLAVVLGALAVTWQMLRRLVLDPVNRLSTASRAIASGDLTARVGLTSGSRHQGDEITYLARDFDIMAIRLEETIVKLQERELFQQALIDAIPDGIRVIDDDFSVVAANRGFCQQVGLALTDVIGRPCHHSSHRQNDRCVPTMIVCPVVEIGKDALPVKCIHAHVDHRTGLSNAFEVIAAPLEIESRGCRRHYVVESIRDLARQAQISQEQRLSEIGLLATGVAHEIHNPLASIRLGLGAIRRDIQADAVTDELKNYMEMVDAEVDRCLEVTKRLMWLSQPPGERGELVDVDKIAHDIVALLHYEAETRKLSIRVEIPKSVRIVANSRELGMIFLNLIQNAFHASKAGDQLCVSACVTESNDVQIAIKDVGVGIAAENLSSIFYPFWSRRADGSSGSGLGLSICKALVEKWKGRIDVQSALQRGTVFVLTFPHAAKWLDRNEDD